MAETQLISKNSAAQWNDAHRFSPATRHRRRIILALCKKIDFETCLDAGCAQPYLLEELRKRNKKVFGCDISDEVIRCNRERFAYIQFAEVDLSNGTYPSEKKFDLVIASETIEHIEDWHSALRNLCRMSDKYLFITAPIGKLYPLDRMIGHFRHFNREELNTEVERNGFKVSFVRYWGAPVYSLYRYLISFFDAELFYQKFAAGKYGLKEQLFSHLLYVLFYLNDVFRSGPQLFLLAEKK